MERTPTTSSDAYILEKPVLVKFQSFESDSDGNGYSDFLEKGCSLGIHLNNTFDMSGNNRHGTLFGSRHFQCYSGKIFLWMEWMIIWMWLMTHLDPRTGNLYFDVAQGFILEKFGLPLIKDRDQIIQIGLMFFGLRKAKEVFMLSLRTLKVSRRQIQI